MSIVGMGDFTLLELKYGERTSTHTDERTSTHIDEQTSINIDESDIVNSVDTHRVECKRSSEVSTRAGRGHDRSRVGDWGQKGKMGGGRQQGDKCWKFPVRLLGFSELSELRSYGDTTKQNQKRGQ